MAGSGDTGGREAVPGNSAGSRLEDMISGRHGTGRQSSGNASGTENSGVHVCSEVPETESQRFGTGRASGTGTGIAGAGTFRERGLGPPRDRETELR